mmetsp:Transcript_85928/g.228380  ORF Transcript_85928/g.228380 Transcript_85928/m.228380 type:complete len:201 (+) Transcript_85928:13-615(+)
MHTYLRPLWPPTSPRENYAGRASQGAQARSGHSAGSAGLGTWGTRGGLIQDLRDASSVGLDVGLDRVPAVLRAVHLLETQVLWERHVGDVTCRVPVRVGQARVGAQRYQHRHGLHVTIARGLHQRRHARVVHLVVHVERVVLNKVRSSVPLLDAGRKLAALGIGDRAAGRLQRAAVVARATDGVEEERAPILVVAEEGLA